MEPRKRLLFICSRNRLRSPTARRHFANSDAFDVRARGTASSAQQRVRIADIEWASDVFVMEHEHADILRREFRDALRGCEVHVLDIPDEYEFMAPELIELIEAGVEQVLGAAVRGTPAVELRVATSADAADIARIQVEGWQTGYRDVLPDEVLDQMRVDDRVLRWERNLSSEGAVTIVAHRGGECLGFASYGPCRDTDCAADTFEIWAIYVSPPAWGTGVGRELLAECADRSRKEGAGSIKLWVLEKNARARRFYEACGFHADGHSKLFETEGGSAPEVRYVRRLK